MMIRYGTVPYQNFLCEKVILRTYIIILCIHMILGTYLVSIFIRNYNYRTREHQIKRLESLPYGTYGTVPYGEFGWFEVDGRIKFITSIILSTVLVR